MQQELLSRWPWLKSHLPRLFKKRQTSEGSRVPIDWIVDGHIIKGNQYMYGI